MTKPMKFDETFIRLEVVHEGEVHVVRKRIKNEEDDINEALMELVEQMKEKLS